MDDSRVIGRINSISFIISGKALVTLEVDREHLASLEGLQDADLDIKIEKHREGRSINANRYFWQLCDQIAKKLHSEKWTIYLLELSKYGRFVDLNVTDEVLAVIKEKFRYVEILDENEVDYEVRCFFGSSSFNTKEMSDLIEGTVQDAQDLGIETMTPDERKKMLAAWKGGKLDGF